MIKPFERLFVALVLLGLCAGLWVASQRFRIERSHRSVELVLDWSQAQEAAASGHLPLPQFLARMHARGITGVAVTEDTLASLRDDGRLAVLAGGPAGSGVRLQTGDASLAARIRQALRQRFPEVATTMVTTAHGAEVRWPNAFDPIRQLSVGLSPRVADWLRSRGLDVVGRISNYPGADPAGIQASLAGLRGQGVRVVIFSAEEVLGYLDQIPATAESFRRTGLLYGSVEFSKQRGDELLSTRLDGRLVRVHSIVAAEMNRMKPDAAIDRYVRATEERNVRLCLVRLLPFATERGVQDQFDYVAAITSGLGRVGLRPGLAAPFPPLNVPFVVRALVAAGVAAALMLLIACVAPVPGPWLLAGFLANSILSAGLMIASPLQGRRLVALEAALVFPTLSGLMAYAWARSRLRRGRPARFLQVLPVFCACTLVSLAGAVAIIGLLSDRLFMMHVDQFLGIKAAHIIPVFTLGLLAGADLLNDGRSWARQWRGAKRRMAALLEQPILIWEALGFAVVAAALLLLVMRTGNDPGIAVSPLEMKMRALLDRLLYVRPRTKEFLLGHPLFWLGLALGPVWGRRSLVALLVLGVIGQASLVNTFCHIHTPLVVSILHAVNGLWLGIAFGALLTWALAPWTPARLASDAPDRKPSRSRGRRSRDE